MFKFGRKPPRSLESFGVAGLLGEECKVYYDSLFNTKNLGRVSDLICARLADQGLDELKLRAVLLFGIFEAVRAGDGDGEPWVVECGIDDEKVALGFSFALPQEWATLAELPRRISENSPANEFESLLRRVWLHTDRVILRGIPGTGRTELVAVLGIPGKLADAGGAAPLEISELSAEKAQASPPAAEYVGLGDLDYRALLKSDRPATKADGSAAGVTRLSGDEGAAEMNLKISGVTDTLAADQTKTVISADANEIEAPLEIAARPVKAVKSLFRKIWPFRKSAPSPEAAEFSDASEADVVAAASVAPAASAPAAPIGGDVDTLVDELKGGGLDHTIERVQREAVEIKKNLASAQAKRWVDGLIADLVAEKARVNEIAKNLHLSVRQKELEFKNKERNHFEDLRRRDENIRQKNNTIVRNKEQIAQLATMLERAKNMHAASNSDEYKQKYALSQKLLAAAKGEAATFQQKLEDLKIKVINRPNGPSQVEFNALKTRYDRMVRQLEDAKRSHQQAVEKLNDRKDRSSGPNTDDLKKKLEGALRLAATNEKEGEKLQLRVEELQREELRLKAEVQRMQNEQRKGGTKPPSQAA